MINVGIIGLGHMGRLHMMNCLHIKDVRIIAVADSSEKALRKAKFVGPSHLYTDYHDLFDDSLNLDAVVISLPNYLHLESIQLALEAGFAVFVEKPMANTVEECRRIVKLVEKSSGKFMVGHSMRFVDAINTMKNSADKGYIGTPEVVTLEEVMNGPFAHPAVPTPVSDWWLDPEKTGGGALIDLGYHLIDLFRFFVGDCRVVFSWFDHRFNLPVEDGAIVILRSSNSSTNGIINVGWFQKTIFPKYDFRVVLHGNAGYISSDDLVPSNPYFHAIKEGTKNLLRRIVGRKIRPLSYTYYYESYYRELEHFFDCVKRDSSPCVSAADGLRTIELVEEAYKFHEKERARGILG
ncbi:MAG: Gfo/Idh/MocA family protein [Promethearchaeota archaeon]